MGLPSQLDGSANGLKLDKPVSCPHCFNVIEYYVKVKRGGNVVLVCPMCLKVINPKKST